MKKITALKKNWLIILVILFGFIFPLTTSASSLSVEDVYKLNINGYIDVDPYSTVELNNSETEIGIWRTVKVKITDRLGNPLPGHEVRLYSPNSSVIFQQSASLTDKDGYVKVEVRSFSPGAYTLRAFDTTNAFDIAIQDTATLYVFPLPVPQLKSEPYYTQGESNTLYWDKIKGFVNSYEYKLEEATDSNFKTIVKSTAWITGTQVKIEGLENGKMYFYRVKARNSGGGESGWSSTVFSVQDNEAPVIKEVEKPKLVKEKNNLTVEFKFNVTDNLSLKKVKLFCITSRGNRECGWLQSTGSNYTATILIDELEKDKFFNFKKYYYFCVEASDEAGNGSSDCDFNLRFDYKEEIPVPIITNIVNSLINSFNTGLQRIDAYIANMLSGINNLALTLIGFVFLLLSLMMSFNILLGNLSLLPALLTQRFLNLWSFFGFRKHGTPMGIVYDAITKKPVPYARVLIYDGNNFLLRTEITYYDGIFRANLDLGRYRIIVEHNSYLFPSNIVKKSPDEEYKNVYKGEYLVVGRRRVINLSIPLDQKNIIMDNEKKVRNHFRLIKFLKHFNVLITTLGFLFSVYALQRDVNIVNLIILLLYIPAFGVYLKSIVKFNIGMK